MKPNLATISLVLGILSFVQLLGVEKAVLAVIFGWLALKEAGKGGNRNLAYVGIGLGVLYIVLVIVFLPQIPEAVGNVVYTTP